MRYQKENLINVQGQKMNKYKNLEFNVLKITTSSSV